MATTHFGSRHMAARVGAAVAQLWRRTAETTPPAPADATGTAPPEQPATTPAAEAPDTPVKLRAAVPAGEPEEAPEEDPAAGPVEGPEGGPAAVLEEEPEEEPAVVTEDEPEKDPVVEPQGDAVVVPDEDPGVEPAEDAEPELPVVTLDDGRRLTLDGAFVLGRDPVAEPGKFSVRIDDPERSVSKTHCAAGVLADGTVWVADRFSANGTCIIDAEGTVHPCPPGEVIGIPPGATVHIGSRSFTVTGVR